MAERIGVFVCECGPNIKEAIDLDTVVTFAQGLKNVVMVKSFNLLCSEAGKKLIEENITKNNLTRVVIAACSPREHEHTFKKVLSNAGLNPYLLQLVNIREQCAWVIKNKTLATEKAKAMIQAAVERVIHHEPLESKDLECQMDALVVGAGIAGISAALTLAQKNRKVYLVEKSPVIGGKVALYEKVFPTLECASCVLDPVLDKVLHNEQIELLTLSEIQEVLGFFGNFIVKVKKNARCVDTKTCIGCGACFEVCPAKVKNEYNEGLDERRAIYIPYAGALPNVAVIDREHCLHFQTEGCNACQNTCPFSSINYEENDEVQELRVGAIVLATGFDVFDPKRAPRYGYGKIDNVYTSLEFERLLNSNGPTGGKILLKNGQPPKKIALIHCVGSRTREYNEYCSGICCMYSLKFAHMVNEQLPDSSISEFYSDFCLPGKESQGFFNNLLDKNGIEFVRVKDLDSIKFSEKKGKILIQYKTINPPSSTLLKGGKRGLQDKNIPETLKSDPFDMVVLSVAIEAAKDAQDLARIFDIPQGKDGFFTEEHTELSPASTIKEGIFIAGCAQGPKDVQSTVTQGQAAAGNILSRLIHGEKLVLEAITATVDEDLCSGCKICIGLCPYKAITYNSPESPHTPLWKRGAEGDFEGDKGGFSDKKENLATINEVLCRGCGICAAACPSGAIKAKHFTDKQIFAEIEGLLNTNYAKTSKMSLRGTG
ncbi:MAG: CoB--CoM heterodisulfide reductase iron-sulfur subunit A family protein [Nitrospira sp.]|nr:CoB--CoM heterodisulfide reductase iron-sulfur subunit A family protein [Nitrospira sp.]